MIKDSAFGSRRARIAMNARIDALHIDTGMVSRTVAIAVATDYSASIQRISMITVTASTVGFMIVGEAFCVYCTVIGD